MQHQKLPILYTKVTQSNMTFWFTYK